MNNQDINNLIKIFEELLKGNYSINVNFTENDDQSEKLAKII